MNLNKAPDCFVHHNNHASENSYFRFVLLCLSILPSHTSALWSMTFRAQKPLFATPDSAFHRPEQQRCSQTYSELPRELSKGDLQQHPQEALSGQIFPFPDRWPCTAALKWDSYTNWKAGWKLWLQFHTLLTVPYTVSSVPGLESGWTKLAPPDSANLLPVPIMEVGLKGKFQLMQPCAMLFAGDCILPHGYAFYICFKSNSVPI